MKTNPIERIAEILSILASPNRKLGKEQEAQILKAVESTWNEENQRTQFDDIVNYLKKNKQNTNLVDQLNKSIEILTSYIIIKKKTNNKDEKKPKANKKPVFFREVPSDINDLAICSDDGRYNRTLTYRTALKLFSTLPEEERRIFLDNFTKKSVGISKHGHALERKKLIINLLNSDFENLEKSNIFNDNGKAMYQFATVCRAALNWLSTQPTYYIYEEIKSFV